MGIPARVPAAAARMDEFIAPRPGTRPRRRGGLCIASALSCLFGSATCFTSSILPGSALSRVLGPALSRTSGSKPAALQALSLHDGHSRRSNAGPSSASSVSGQDTRSIAGMYGLVKDPIDALQDSERDPYRVQQVKLDAHVTRMCTAIMENRTAAGTALRNLSSLAVAVELRSHSKDRRTFVLPGNITVRLRERSYSQSGLGGSLWGSGIGLSILLGRNCKKSAPLYPMGMWRWLFVVSKNK